MTEDGENASPSAGVARSDELAVRIAVIEGRLDQIDAALNMSGLADFLQRQQAAHEKHEKLLTELKREQDSLRIQTLSETADNYEEGRPIANGLSLIGLFFVILICWVAYTNRPRQLYELEFKRGSHLVNQIIVKASLAAPPYRSAVIDHD